MNQHHPYDTFGGVFIPHFLLSSRRLSLGAKLLYALLATRTDVRGESLLNHDLLASEMGVADAVVLSLADELSAAGVVQIWQDPAATKTLRCQFPPDAWQQDDSPEQLLAETAEPATRTAPRLLRLPIFTAAELAAPAGDQKFPEPDPKLGKARIEARARQSKKEPASRFSKQICTDYARARQLERGNIANPFALGTAMWKSGEYDEEIMLWLQSKEADESAA